MNPTDKHKHKKYLTDLTDKRNLFCLQLRQTTYKQKTNKDKQRLKRIMKEKNKKNNNKKSNKL